jgi:hypothetical protein
MTLINLKAKAQNYYKHVVEKIQKTISQKGSKTNNRNREANKPTYSSESKQKENTDNKYTRRI